MLVAEKLNSNPSGSTKRSILLTFFIFLMDRDSLSIREAKSLYSLSPSPFSSLSSCQPLVHHPPSQCSICLATSSNPYVYPRQLCPPANVYSSCRNVSWVFSSFFGENLSLALEICHVGFLTIFIIILVLDVVIFLLWLLELKINNFFVNYLRHMTRVVPNNLTRV